MECARRVCASVIIMSPAVQNENVSVINSEATMNRSHSLSLVFGLLTIFVLASFGLSQEPLATAQQAPPPAVTTDDAVLQNAIEVQTRGPLHEAFAQPFDMPPEPGTLVPKEPPPPIPEE